MLSLLKYNFACEVICSKTSCKEAFEHMMKEECAVIFVDAEWQEALQAQALRCRDRVLPAVLFLPGSGVAAEEALQEAVRRALGTDAV